MDFLSIPSLSIFILLIALVILLGVPTQQARPAQTARLRTEKSLQGEQKGE